MINANELRIGNYLNAHGGNDATFCKPDQPRFLSVVELIGDGFFKWRAINEMPKYYHSAVEGIPLTDEWLDRGGVDLSVDNIRHVRHFGMFTITFLYDDVHRSWGCYIDGKILLAILEYVHEWQNLHFALSGEEITFKEK